MFNRFGFAAIALAFAVVSMPAVSEAGHVRTARPSCAVTKMFHRRAVTPVVRTVRVKRVEPFARLRKMFVRTHTRLVRR